MPAVNSHGMARPVSGTSGAEPDLNSLEYLRRLYQRVHAARRCMLSEVDEQCVDEGKLALRLLGCIPVEFIEQQGQLLRKGVRYSL